jgi:acyl dehydratase
VKRDYNPLHADPEMASSVGFDRPILHGLCSFGIAARAVLLATTPVGATGSDDPSRLLSIRVRFVKPAFPGDTLVTRVWRHYQTPIPVAAATSAAVKETIVFQVFIFTIKQFNFCRI